MTDLPPPHPLDEQADALLDAGRDAPAGDPALAARLAELQAVRAALADVPPPPTGLRERSIAAALAAFDEGEGRSMAAVPSPPAPPVTSIATAAARRDARRHRRQWLPIAAAAAVVLMLGLAGVNQALRSDDESGALNASTAADVATKAVAAEADRSSAAAGGAASEQTVAGAAATAAAATTAAASATTAAAVAAPPRPADTGAATTALASTAAGTASAKDEALNLPYLGDLSTAADLAAARDRGASGGTTTTRFDDGAAAVRQAVVDSTCRLDGFGRPVALARWRGAPAVVVDDATVTRVVQLDTCAVVEQVGP